MCFHKYGYFSQMKFDRLLPIRKSANIVIVLIAVQLVGAQAISDLELINKAYDAQNPNESLNLLQQVNDVDKLADTLRNKYYLASGIAYGQLGKGDSSIYYLTKCVDAAKVSKDDYTLMRAYNSIGVLSRIQGDHERSLGAFQNAEKIALENAGELRFQEAKSDIIGNIGGIFYQLKDYQSSWLYAKKSLDNSLQTADTAAIGNGYLMLAIVSEALDSIRQSINYNKQALAYLEVADDINSLAYVENNLGDLYQSDQKYKEALIHYLRATKYALTLGDAETQAHTNLSVGNCYLQLGQLYKAKDFAMTGLKIAEQGKYPIHSKNAHNLLFKVARQSGDYKKALEEKLLSTAINDSLNAAEAMERLADVEARYETEKKQQQIELLTTQNELSAISLEKKSREQMTVIIGAIVLLIIGLSVTYFIIRQARLKERLLTEETDNLRLRITSLIEQSPEAPEIDLEELNKRLLTPLTEREFEIFELAISQHSNSEIAEKVFLSVNTVKFHLKKVYEKLGVANRKEALHFAIKQEKPTL